jgi:hypothetical protein
MAYHTRYGTHKKITIRKNSFFRLPQVVLLGCAALSPSTTLRTTPPTRAQKTLQQHLLIDLLKENRTVKK